MGFFERTKRAYQAFVHTEKRSVDGVSVGNLTAQSLLDAMGLNSGSVVVTPETAIKLATVFRCVDLLSSTAAAMPWELFRKTGNIREPATSHPNYSLYKLRPHPELTSFIWRKTLFTHALLWGNGYARIFRNGIGRPVKLKIYHPNKVSIREFEDQIFYSFEGGEYIPSDDVIHFKLFTTDGYCGRSVIRMAADSLKIPMHAQRFANSFMENGARVSGVLTHPGKMSDPAKEGLAKGWRKFVGSGSAGDTPILDEGVKYEQIGIPPSDFELLKMASVSNETICTWYGVPQHLAGILEHATFSNIEYQDLEYVKYSLLPHLVNFEQEIDYKTLRLVELGEYYTKINVNGLLRADIKTRFEAYRTGIQNGFMSPNMAAELEEYNPIEGGDRRFIQQNMMPLDSVDTVLSGQNTNTKRALRALLASLEGEGEAESADTDPQTRKAINGHNLNGHALSTN